MNRDELSPIKTAWIGSRLTLIYRLVGGETGEGDSVGGLPEECLRCGGAILTHRVTGMGGSFATAIRR